nr:hypothetical protein [Ureaplasma sp.]
MSIVLYISFKKDNPENIPLYLTAIYPIPFLLIFIGLYIPGIIQLTKLPINKQDKLTLLLSWIIINPLYILVFLIYYGIKNKNLILESEKYEYYKKKIFIYSVIE